LKKDEATSKFIAEIAALKEQLAQANDSLSRERSAFMTESDKLRLQAQEQERELNEI
jgi:hypothetical protein